MNLNGNPLVTAITWTLLGQPSAWIWAFASLAIAAGRLTATEFSG
ncbi:hypothetical protein [Variovorax sp. E3]|nr:hypothetical protein [Variovorax sp. E3]